MRKEFACTIEKITAADKKILFLTGDLGFMALENVQVSMKNRFINAGVSEQNIVSMAAGLASQGFTAICYSIAPFIVFRPAEQIRLDIALHNKNVKLVGNGGGYGYGIMGATHHAIEDIAVLSSFQNLICYIPFCNEDVESTTIAMMKTPGPAYLRLGYGVKPQGLNIPSYQPVRKLKEGSSLTVVSMGPVCLNVFTALENMPSDISADIFIVNEMPMKELNDELISSLKKTGRLLILEEHVMRGGLGENLALILLKQNISCKFRHLYAKGYPEGLYGSQNFHYKMSGMDPSSISSVIQELADE